MKIRIHKNSIRLRLSQTEVDQIGKGDSLVENLCFPDEETPDFCYALVTNKEIPSISAGFSGRKIEIKVPSTDASNWAHSDQVGLEALLKINDKGDLHISIEKDFQCLHKRPGEDETDNFPHPDLGTSG
ncbi:MAG: hypothetical protein WD398_00885 [Cyclobacteriaceae bacterium]